MSFNAFSLLGYIPEFAHVGFVYKNGKIELLDINDDEKHKKFITYFFRFLVDGKERGILNKIAKEVGASRFTVSRWAREKEKDVLPIQSDYFMSIAKFFDISPSWFYSTDIYKCFDEPKTGEKYKLNERNKYYFLSHLGKWKYWKIEERIQKNFFYKDTFGEIFIQYANDNGYILNPNRNLDKEIDKEIETGRIYLFKFHIFEYIEEIAKLEISKNNLTAIPSKDLEEEKKYAEFILYYLECEIEEKKGRKEQVSNMIETGIAEGHEAYYFNNHDNEKINFNEMIERWNYELKELKEWQEEYESKLQKVTNITNE